MLSLGELQVNEIREKLCDNCRITRSTTKMANYLIFNHRLADVVHISYVIS